MIDWLSKQERQVSGEGILVRCRQCNTPICELKDGCLIIKVKHHGELHTSTFPINKLMEVDSPDEPDSTNVNT